eukprot:6206912-Pleurochrysis_carterae.AAC.3
MATIQGFGEGQDGRKNLLNAGLGLRVRVVEASEEGQLLGVAFLVARAYCVSCSATSADEAGSSTTWHFPTCGAADASAATVWSSTAEASAASSEVVSTPSPSPSK